MKTKKFKLGLIAKIMAVAVISIIITAAVLVSVSVMRLGRTYEDLIVEELKATAVHLAEQLSDSYNGDWWIGNDGNLMKGGKNVQTVFEEELDALYQKTGIDYTIFYGDTRYVTTIQKKDGSGKLVGTRASDTVVKEVLQDGNEYAATDLNIEGYDYFGYYVPLSNADGSIVGMCFTGRNSEDVHATLFKMTLSLLLTALFIVAIVIAISAWINRTVSGEMHGVSESLTSLAGGTLDAGVDDKIVRRSDELGVIGHSTRDLISRIGSIIGKTKEMSTELTESGAELARSSDDASQAATQISAAVDGISKGAVSQADSIRVAKDETDVIGESVELISENVSLLDGSSEKMRVDCEGTRDALNTLISQSKIVFESVHTIAATIDRTNQSAKAIAGFTDAINSIATQTNLLSLNASIEAARAGEAGKGFAVVAGEISDLASQSKESADKINGIVEELMRDADESVEAMRSLSDNFDRQEQQLDMTKESMDRMAEGIAEVTQSSQDISGSLNGLQEARSTLNRIIADLSDISGENATATEQTNASMEELSSTFQLINSDAEKLRSLAAELTETISYFH